MTEETWKNLCDELAKLDKNLAKLREACEEIKRSIQEFEKGRKNGRT